MKKIRLFTRTDLSHLFPKHPEGTSINFTFCEEIINSDIPFITVVYEKYLEA